MPTKYFGRLKRNEQIMLQGPGTTVGKKWKGNANTSDMNKRSVGSIYCKTVDTQPTTDNNTCVTSCDGADSGEGLCGSSSDSKLINVLIKMQSQLGTGMPEVGLVLAPRKDDNNDARPACRVKTVIKGSPAYYCDKIEEGDTIRRVNMVDVTKMQPEEVVSMLRRAVIDSKWTYSPIRLQLQRSVVPRTPEKNSMKIGTDVNLMSLMSIAIKKNSQMVSSKKPSPIHRTLLQRGFCDRLDKALAKRGYYDVTYHL